jgi:hypothetical protein
MTASDNAITAHLCRPFVAAATALSYGPMTTLILLLGLLQATPARKVEIVSVTGCLQESPPNTWTLRAATDPTPSSANAPSAKEIPTTPPAGKNAFTLIGVSEFNLPAHRDHTVVIKGLLIKATPMSRVNMTSVTAVSPSCPAAAK